MDVLTVVNTLSAERAVRNLESMNEAKRRELQVLSTEPAIARIVAEDEHGKQRTYSFHGPRRTPNRATAARRRAIAHRSAAIRAVSVATSE